MIDKCPFCGSKAGYQTKTVERLFGWYEWDGTAIDTSRDWISGGKNHYCMDCGKVVTKYIKETE